MTHLKIVHLILKYWSHGSYISLFFVHYVTGIIRLGHRAEKIGNVISLGWGKKETALASGPLERLWTWLLVLNKFWEIPARDLGDGRAGWDRQLRFWQVS